MGHVGRRVAGLAARAGILVAFAATGPHSLAGEGPGRFFRGIDLNGPPLVIDGNAWVGDDSGFVECQDPAFEDQAVTLDPPTDPERSRMIRTSRWSGTARMRFTRIPRGAYEVFVYVWEDNDPETFTILLDGREAVRDFDSGRAGTWKKLGPWRVQVESGSIELSTRGGAANISGVEIWESGPPPPPIPKAVDPAAARHFDEVVAPVLARHCLECHGGSIRKGGLDLSAERSARLGGDGGPPIEAGKPEESLLWEQVESGEMPRGRPPLGDADKQVIRRWIADGATWGTPEVDPFVATTGRRGGYDWWSLQPVRRPEVPAVRASSWPRNDVDRFVLAKLESKGLTPAAEADRRTLIRRLSFDLIGLPPTPEEVARFVGDVDGDEAAYEKLVDRLLDSPHHGERWARHWLDVIRFGESQGYERNRIRDNAWRYRDWVVDSFNADRPYDEFARLQVAGDVLAPGDLDSLIATGYHVSGTWDQVAHYEASESMKKATRWDEIEDLVGTFGQAFLGLSIQCARCHDHKFDPISQKEYYQVAALFGGINQEEKERDRIELRAKGGRPEFTGVAHVPHLRQPPVFSLLDRGDPRQPLGAVAPAALKSIPGLPGDFGLPLDAPEADRRVALARWLTDPRNPLTARVMVNRVWYYHFGRGLVETPSDFGYNGGRPSHPGLLDYLASRFVEGGWKVKDLHRQIARSAAYRQASRVKNGGAEAVDSENQFLWRAGRRRLEGEALRDSVLAVSGALSPQIGGPSYRDVKVDLGNNHTFTLPTGEFSAETNRRTIYRLWARSGNNPLLESLDCPDPSVMTPRRTSTITPVQSLSMMNDAFMEECAGRFAGRVRDEAGEDVGRQVDRAWRLALSRPPNDREAEVARSFVRGRGLAPFCLVLFNTNEFLFVD